MTQNWTASYRPRANPLLRSCSGQCVFFGFALGLPSILKTLEATGPRVLQGWKEEEAISLGPTGLFRKVNCLFFLHHCQLQSPQRKNTVVFFHPLCISSGFVMKWKKKKKRKLSEWLCYHYSQHSLKTYFVFKMSDLDCTLWIFYRIVFRNYSRGW